jgi:hypothetical protein
MKLRHFPKALVHDPIFVLRNALGMLAHTFRGSSAKSLLGLEDERQVFVRYRALRKGRARLHLTGRESADAVQKSASGHSAARWLRGRLLPRRGLGLMGSCN